MGQEIERLLGAFDQAGWLDGRAEGYNALAQALATSTELLPALASHWQALAQSFRSPRSSQRWERLAQWGTVQQANGSLLGAGVDCLRGLGKINVPVLANRLVYWPYGFPPRASSWSAVVSSRLGRKLAENPKWLLAFRDAGSRIHRQNEILVSADGSTVGRSFAQAAAGMFRLNWLLIREPGNCRDLPRWLRRLTINSAIAEPNGYEAWISPPCPATSAESLEIAPFRDQILFDLCDKIYLIHIRPKGNIERLVRLRLANPRNTQKFIVPVEYSLVPKNLAEELFGLGAIAWEPRDVSLREYCPTTSCRVESITNGTMEASSAKIQNECCFNSWCFLTHCTRAHFGPWPEQSEEEFFGELLRGEITGPRTPMTSLMRIVRQRILRASGSGIRGGSRVVCFSELPLNELLQMRSFKSHRGRWDFEPYGLCIHRDWLLKQGARPVIYGTNHDWEKLAEADRPFFQRSTTSAARGSRVLDWTEEREWRHPGDVDLSELPSDYAMLFVPTREEADDLARFSPWPVLVVRDLTAQS